MKISVKQLRKLIKEVTQQDLDNEEPVFPDTLKGAKEALKFMSDHDKKNIDKAEGSPGQEKGSWILYRVSKFPGSEEYGSTTWQNTMVFLKGYPDSWGKVRKMNDFEDFDEDAMDHSDRGPRGYAF